MKTRHRSWELSYGDCPGKRFSWISGHFGFQVKVMNQVGRPNDVKRAEQLWKRRALYSVPPVKFPGRVT